MKKQKHPPLVFNLFHIGGLQIISDCQNTSLLRMAVNSVEGYVINTTIPWCSSYARSEPSYSVLIRKKQMIKYEKIRQIFILQLGLRCILFTTEKKVWGAGVYTP